jgi:hypothetical protein
MKDISLHACMYVSVYIYRPTRIYTKVFEAMGEIITEKSFYMCVYIYTHIRYACMGVYTHAHIYVYTHRFSRPWEKSSQEKVSIHMRCLVCLYTHIYMYIHTGFRGYGRIHHRKKFLYICDALYGTYRQGAEKEAPDSALACVPERRFICSGGAPGEHVCVCVYTYLYI